MTQFALFCGPESPPSFLRRLNESDQPVLLAVGEAVFNRDDGFLWVIEDEGDDVDSIAIEAQKQLCGGAVFEDTRLFKIVRAVSSWVSDCVFWYAGEFEDLVDVDEIEALKDLVREPVAPNTSCEIYARYRVENS